MKPAVRALRYWLTRYRRVWRATIFSTVLIPILYLGGMGFGLSALMSHRAIDGLGATGYMTFLAPGLLAAQAMLGGQSEATYPVYSAVNWGRNYQAATASPLSPGDIFLGHFLFITLRVTMNSAVFMVVMAFFGLFRSAAGLAAFPAAVLTGTAFAAAVQALAVSCTTDTPLHLLQRFGVIPLFLFSGTFYPISRLPAVLRSVAYLTPLMHGVALCRTFTAGPVTAANLPAILAHLSYLSALTVAGVYLARRAYAWRLCP